MSDKYQFKFPEIPMELHEKLWAAQDAYDEKVAYIERIGNAKATLEAEIITMKAERETAKEKYLDGFEKIAQGRDEFAEENKAASSLVSELSNKISGHQEALADYEKKIWPAKSSLRDLADEVDKARTQILRFIVSGIPNFQVERPRRHSLEDHVANGSALDLSELMVLFMARQLHFNGVGDMYAVKAKGFGGVGFFEFVGHFFSPVSDEYASMLKTKLDNLIWGEREPAPIIRLRSNL